MACFVAPAAVAIVATVAKKKIPKKYHVEWLLLMLWGGVLMLILDHIASGEIVTYSPFFTSPFSTIWREVINIGAPMAIVIVVLWITMVWVSIGIETRNSKLLIEKK